MNFGPKFYIGARTEVRAVVVDHRGRQLNPRLDLANHSPTGFNWGYMGSGPAQLALAILADYLEDDQRALRLYQDFKENLIGKIHTDAFTITHFDIERFLNGRPGGIDATE